MNEILDIKDFGQVTSLAGDDRILLTIAEDNHFAGTITTDNFK